MDRREHHRAQLRLPVRIRWNTPFGQKTEVCRTLDISRGGLLVPCGQTHAPGVPLWVTFPYDGSMGDTQPEIMARVVRLQENGHSSGPRAKDQAWAHRAVAVHFALSPRIQNGNGHFQGPERRGSPRRSLAIPVHVRPEGIPWFEEAMVIDASAQGLRFLSSREYHHGQKLLFSFEAPASAPWLPASESLAHVVRIEPQPESAAVAISVAREL
jgi:PilZ domain